MTTHAFPRPSTSPLARPTLADGLLARPESVVVLSAIAGTGKTTLLSALAHRLGQPLHTGPLPATLPDGTEILLWDLSRHAPTEAESEALFAWVEAQPRRRALVAKRPGAALAGLDRAVLYGKAVILDFGALALRPDEPSFDGMEATGLPLALTAGWAVLCAPPADAGRRAAALPAFLEAEILAELDPRTLAALDMLVHAAGPVTFAAPDPTVAAEFARLAPIVRTDTEGTGYSLGIPSIRHELASAVAAAMKRTGKATQAEARAEIFRSGGQITEAINTLQQAGLHSLALDWFTEAHGFNYIYYYGYEAFDRVLAGFPDELARESDVLVFSLALQALKSGNLPRARLLITERFGPNAHSLTKVFAPDSEFSLAFRCFRLITMIYEEVTISDRTLEQIFGILAELPVHDHQRRGTFYNSVLEIYVRRRRFAEAEGIAERALVSYRQIDAHLLVFYIHIFLAAIALMQGNVRQARPNTDAARASMAKLPFESPSDRRILILLEACIAYEDGNIEQLAVFLSDDLDHFAMGEIWPSLAEFAIHYGSQTLSRHLSTFAARSFLELWRIQQWQSRRFRMMIEMREAAILQNVNRWLEAAEKLSVLQSRINRTWVEAAVDQLVRVADHDELALVLSWLRHLVHEVPMRRELQSQIAALQINDHVTRRQKIALLVWSAYVARRQRDLTNARATLLKAYEEAARLACIAPLMEEMVFLKEMIDDKRVSEFLQSSPMARQVARRLDAIDAPTTTSSANTAGLSRRETRVLLLIAEGGSNKFVARHLGISEATVKFHLSNLYRKLGCTGRREAIAAARALRLIA
ncbi:LuxR C-terminal-related transcriptional regulator [Kaistia dalseonensis]|uniref:ATP/maltotriose-dependent transcriptional regulator MalT n=1 Tax=Kaistia dalseonensis TaxID=410840 RepID=A0ABU0H0Q0_9HYPH|nr:LuxR family transcriptional regulator [Kaistia dalseonensis]MCX5493319.1 LuxR C-terminal-related transcriptional regulator [Kaistia dalseonensis]MDQ0435876.1 ATP/maltotriose-dependent transcriptional regulator MalT [Kaistia dalseonensis]